MLAALDLAEAEDDSERPHDSEMEDQAEDDSEGGEGEADGESGDADGPEAMAETKKLIAVVAGQPRDDTLIADTAARIARVRGSEEGREGVAAFLEKRQPGWIKE